MADQSPFQVLREIRDNALALAKQELRLNTQLAGIKNIAYVVNDVYFYCDARDVKEVAVCENLMLVPQTKRWMRGLVNSKGVLYSVTDLALLAGYERPVPTNKGHLLLMSDEEAQSALLVNRVVGFRYFNEAQRIENLIDKQDLLDGLAGFVDSGYHADGHDWYHLNVGKLMASEQFREIQ
jgi:chemotaxis signal transduction protein